MKKLDAGKVKHIVKDMVLSVIAGFLNAICVHIFVNPNQFIPGGLTGIASLLYYIFPMINISTTYILLNVPLLIMAIIFIKSEFTINTIIATISCTLFLRYLPQQLVFTSSPLISTIAGGLLIGLAMYVANIANGSNAGTEVVARLVADRRPELDISYLILICNMTILCVGSFVMVVFQGASLWIVLYSVIFIFMGGEIMGIFLRGVNHPQKFIVITDKYEEIAPEIVKTTRRGLNVMNLFTAEGEVRQDKKGIIVLCQYRQSNLIKSIIRRHDAEAFVIIKDVGHVFSRPTFVRSYKYEKNK